MHVSSAHITEYETNEISTIKTAVHAVTVDIKCISLIFESIPVRKTNLGHLGIFVLTLLLLCLRTYVILSSCLCVFDTLLCKRDVFHLLDGPYCVAWTLKLRRHDCVVPYADVHYNSRQERTGSSKRPWLSRQTGPVSSGVTMNPGGPLNKYLSTALPPLLRAPPHSRSTPSFPLLLGLCPSLPPSPPFLSFPC